MEKLPNKYKGKDGTQIEIIEINAREHYVAFNREKVMHGKFLSRIECICWAAHKRGMSAKEMDWEPCF